MKRTLSLAYKSRYKSHMAFICLYFIISSSGCSQKMAYQALQEAGKNRAQCELIADVTERDKCLAKYNQNYETCQKQREQVLDKK